MKINKYLIILTLTFIFISGVYATNHLNKGITGRAVKYTSCSEVISGDSGQGNPDIAGVVSAVKSNGETVLVGDKCSGAGKTFNNPDGTAFVGYTQLTEVYCTGNNAKSRVINVEQGKYCKQETVTVSSTINVVSAKVIALTSACYTVEGGIGNEKGEKKKNSCGGNNGLTYKRYTCNGATIQETSTTCSKNCNNALGCDICVDTDESNNVATAGVVTIRGANGQIFLTKPDICSPNGKAVMQYECNKDGSFKLVTSRDSKVKPCSTGNSCLLDSAGAGYCTKVTISADTVMQQLNAFSASLNVKIDEHKTLIDGLTTTSNLEKDKVEDLRTRLSALEGTVTQLKVIVESLQQAQAPTTS